MQSTLRILSCASLAVAVAACGSGSSGGAAATAAPAPAPSPAPAPAPAPAPSASPAQGFWGGAVDAQTSVSTVVLPEGQVYEVFQAGSSTTLVVGAVTVDAKSAFSISGRSYSLGTSVNGAYAASGTVAPKGTLNVAASGATAAYSLTYGNAYESPASLADATGHWNTSFAGGTLTVGLDIASTGSITGSSSSGCTYSGNLLPHAGGVAVFDLQLNEACPGSVTSLSGIATLNAGKTVLSAAFVSSDQSAANVFQATH
jgi:hypothetical protein